MKPVICFFFACVMAGPVLAQTIAIRTGTLIDPGTGRVSHGDTIVIERGLITAVGPKVAIPSGAQLIDLSDEWILPGLIDAHTHLSLSEHPADTQPLEATYLRESTAYRALRGMRNAINVLWAGFTTIRDIGNSGDYAMQDVRRAIERGLFIGPTVIDSGKIIAPFGGQSHDIPPELGPVWKFDYLDADSVAEIRKAVRVNLYYGAGVIKLVLDNSAYHYTVEELRAAVEEAHHAGVPVAVHVYGGEAADNAIEAGVDSIEHGFDLTDAQLAKMRSKGIFLAGTDYPQAHLEMIGTAGGLLPDPAVLAPHIIDRLARAHRIGVRVVFSTDTVDDFPGRTRADVMLDYLGVWRAAGMGPADILKAMTSEPADLLRLSGSRGRLVVGQHADLIALPADPLAAIENLRKVNFVMKDGQAVRNVNSSPTPP